MVVERFKNGDARAVYERLLQKGRMLPDGLTFVDSWVTEDMRLCYQLMKAEDEALIDEWIKNWSDLVEFTVRPVVSGADVAKAFAKSQTQEFPD